MLVAARLALKIGNIKFAIVVFARVEVGTAESAEQDELFGID